MTKSEAISIICRGAKNTKNIWMEIRLFSYIVMKIIILIIQKSGFVLIIFCTLPEFLFEKD